MQFKVSFWPAARQPHVCLDIPCCCGKRVIGHHSSVPHMARRRPPSGLCLTLCLCAVLGLAQAANGPWPNLRQLLRRGCKSPPCNELLLPLTSAPAQTELEVVLHYVNTPVGKMPLFMCRHCGCDLCKQALQLGYFAAPTSKVYHHVLEGQCKDGKGLVVDAGANIGYFAVMAASAYGCRVVAFEPNPGPRMYLKASVDLHEVQGLVKVHHEALGSGNSSASFHAKQGRWAFTEVILDGSAGGSDGGSSGSGSNRQTPSGKSLAAAGGAAGRAAAVGADAVVAAAAAAAAASQPAGRQSRVDVRTLSSFVQQDVLLLKVDTENFELMVFAGAWPLLEQFNVQNVVVEVKNFNSPEKRELLHQIFTKGRFNHVYSYKEEYWSYTGSMQAARVNGTDVTAAVRANDLSVSLPFEDFWFSKVDRSAVVFRPKNLPKAAVAATGAAATPAATADAAGTAGPGRKLPSSQAQQPGVTAADGADAGGGAGWYAWLWGGDRS